MSFGGKRRGWRGPRQVVLIDARVAVIALSDHRDEVHRKLERRELRVAANFTGCDLIDGRAKMVISAFGSLGLCRAQERSIRCRMSSRIGIAQLQIGDYCDFVF